MDVANALLGKARAIGASSLAVVGVSKNAGKSVVVGALAAALMRAGCSFGVCSVGRDGEPIDALSAAPKPRLFLRPGVTIATASSLLPRTPALEILALTEEQSALGRIVLARLRAPGYVELAGPASAAGVRRMVAGLRAYADFIIIDGALDRLAALRSEDAVVVAVGAASAPTLTRAVDEVAALVERLRLPGVDAPHPAVRIDGALLPAVADALVHAGERRQVVVADPMRITLKGRSFLALAAQLNLRCEHPLHPIACTVAPLARERSFAAEAFAQAVAARTRLPTYDVYAGSVAGEAVA